MKKIIICFITLVLFSQCDYNISYVNKNKDNEDIFKSNDSSTTPTNEKAKVIRKLKINSKLTAIAQYIAGIDNETYSYLQQKDYYQAYKQDLDTVWKRLDAVTYKPIKVWSRENEILTDADTLPVFYPFSGPDFVYAHAFFPYSQTYILSGLEKSGLLPELTTWSDSALNNYLKKIKHSFRYMNEVGYFTTNQMKNDFKNEQLDGTIHILLFYLARTGYNIVNIQQVKIDEYGNTVPISKSKVSNKDITGYQIHFCDNEAVDLRKLFYFPFDARDKNLKNNLHFLYFLSSFKEKITYLKSASYTLHDSKFTMMRNAILKQTTKLLQDDTGIPYDILKSSPFYVELYGNYTKTISDFEFRYQHELFQDMKKTNQKYLPFKMGYNAWYNEMVLIYAHKDKVRIAEKKKKTNPKKTNNNEIEKENTQKENQLVANDNYKINPNKMNGLIYKIQIKTSSKIISKNSNLFKKLPPVSYYQVNNIYKYVTGNEKTIEACNPLIEKARDNGFDGAFVVAFYNGKRISLQEARKISNQ